MLEMNKDAFIQRAFINVIESVRALQMRPEIAQEINARFTSERSVGVRCG